MTLMSLLRQYLNGASKAKTSCDMSKLLAAFKEEKVCVQRHDNMQKKEMGNLEMRSFGHFMYRD